MYRVHRMVAPEVLKGARKMVQRYAAPAAYKWTNALIFTSASFELSCRIAI
jgi:hypothetical protein